MTSMMALFWVVDMVELPYVGLKILRVIDNLVHVLPQAYSSLTSYANGRCVELADHSYPLYTALLSGSRWIGNPINHSSTTMSVSPSCLSAHVFNHTRFSESN